MGTFEVLMNPHKTFSGYVGGALKRKGISLRRLCRETGSDPSFISKVLRGILPPPSDEKLIRKLAAALALDPVTLIISTGAIPREFRGDPESIKRRLERRVEAGEAAPASNARQRAAGSVPSRSFFKSPHLSEDLL